MAVRSARAVAAALALDGGAAPTLAWPEFVTATRALHEVGRLAQWNADAHRPCRFGRFLAPDAVALQRRLDLAPYQLRKGSLYVIRHNRLPHDGTLGS